MARVRLLLSGTVQGVGLRPHVLRTAKALGVHGFVCNTGGKVEIQAQAASELLERFVQEVEQIEPPAALTAVQRSDLPEQLGDVDFRIVESHASDIMPALPPDLAPCAECLAEVEAPGGRRSGYPFTACTRCGPRYSIVEQLPYDRAGTTLATFQLCADCEREYDAVPDRRCHAQAIACPQCGPTLELLDGSGRCSARGREALSAAATLLREGRILALKGVGGFQLLVDALDEAAVRRLRERKRREEKPFAVLFVDVVATERYAKLGDTARALLQSAEAPIVLVERATPESGELAASVAPENPELGCLLPASPLHRLLARAVDRPLVCTSGNTTGEPLCIDNAEAVERLANVADAFLVHNRAIARPLDDSVARAEPRGITLLRRGRGYAPGVVARLPPGATVLALGAELKAAPALLLDGALVLGQHVGDLGELRTLAAFERNTADILRFFEARPAVVACDLHPDYASTHQAQAWATKFSARLLRVQHHHAHIAAVVAEHGLSGPVLGLAWDGTGLGTDHTIWGGEVLIVDGASCRRFARLPTFRLPGGDRAAREPWRSALGLLFSVEPELARTHAQAWTSESAVQTLLSALARGTSSPVTSSIGRLFDAVAALAGRPQRIAFEGQAAMQLEFAARRSSSSSSAYPLDFELLGPNGDVAESETLAPLTHALLHDVAQATPLAEIAGKFHAALVAAAVRVADRAGLQRVALSGGCFQNQLLLGTLTEALQAHGHVVYTAGQIPPNDGGIAAGQAAVAAWAIVGE